VQTVARGRTAGNGGRPVDRPPGGANRSAPTIVAAMPATPLRAGKLPVALLARVLADDRPPPPEVRVGPAVGEDACAIELEGGVVLVAATDPITLTTSDLGRYAVVVNANDVAVMGVRPRWFLAAVLLPVGTTTEALEELFTTTRGALAEIGATLVGGHTEVTTAVRQPVVVGQMLGVAANGHIVTSSGARPGDVLVQVGPAPVEGAAVLAVEAADRLDGVSPDVVAAAARALHDPGISIVHDALAAASSGATAMHDPTEGGIASGLHELAAAAGAAVRVDRSRLLWFEPGVEVCRALRADPWATLASGCLLATFPPERAEAAVDVLSASGRAASVLGAIEAGTGVRDRDGVPIPWPERDEVARVLDSSAR
jgi:hydrogenase expression/formation protein HypE